MATEKELKQRLGILYNKWEYLRQDLAKKGQFVDTNPEYVSIIDEIHTIEEQLSKKENKGLFKVGELRPGTWSKTITIFDVYETDEEGFQPYVSPLAVVGSPYETTSTTTDTTTTDTTATDTTGTG